jgi:hypothetical protein
MTNTKENIYLLMQAHINHINEVSKDETDPWKKGYADGMRDALMQASQYLINPSAFEDMAKKLKA